MPLRYTPTAAARVLLLALAALWGAATHAQGATVRGSVTDAADGTPLPGVNVAVTGPTGELAGAATDTDGLYVVAGLTPGRYVLRATFVGYATRVDTLDLEAGVRTYSFEMEAGASALDEVVVSSERTGGSIAVEAGVQRITPADIALIPAPDVSGDLTTYLTTLPGVVTTGDQGGQLFIRGGEPSQNLVLLDGIQLYQPFHVLGFYSAFPTDIVSQADVYAGAYPAEFGGELSSVLDVAARPGSLRELQAAASVAPFVTTALAEGPIWRDRMSLLANARISTVQFGAEQLTGRDLPYHFGDVFAKFHAVPHRSTLFSATSIYTYDRGQVGDPASLRPDEVAWTNLGVSGRFLLLPVSTPYTGEVVLAYSRLNTTLGAAGSAVERSSDLRRFDGGFNLTYYVGRAVDVGLGGQITTLATASSLDGLFQNADVSGRNITEGAAYLEPEFRPGLGLKIRPGVRLTTSPNLRLTFVEPRVRALWAGGPHQLSAAAGLYHQALVGLSDRRDATSIFTAWATTPTGSAAQAFHAVGGYRFAGSGPVSFSLEGYYKALEDLSVAEWTATPRFTTNVQSATGEAYGGDARIEARVGRFFGFVNYGLGWVRYTATRSVYELWFGQRELEYRPPHDRRHQVSALISTEVAGVNLSARWQFGSGLPFSRALGFDVFQYIGDGIDPFTEEGAPRVIYEEPYNGELPTYHRLDVSADRDFEVGRATITAQLGLVNAYDRRNLFAYDVFTLRRSDQLPVVPIIGIRVAY